MILREHKTDSSTSDALYSEDLDHRLSLTRVWDTGRDRLLFIMLNPSTATERQNDPTVERCERRARALGYGAMRVCNIFSLRETDPANLRRHPAPHGPDNDMAILDACLWADRIICAWGTHGSHLNRGAEVEAMLRATREPLFTLGLTRDGHPRHPLYVSYATRPVPWPETAVRA